jgi:class 3 adenylate cyclase
MSTNETFKNDASRLWELIEERGHPGADTAAVDERIWQQFGQEWAIVFTDLVGFSRQVAQFGIIHFLQIIHDTKRLLSPIIAQHDGIIVKLEADSLMLLFHTSKTAVECAVAMQRACKAANAERSPEDQLILCAGVGFGKLLRIGTDDVFGHQVNLASRLGEDTARGGEILVTNAARAAAGDVAGITWEQQDKDFAGETSCWAARYAK